MAGWGPFDLSGKNAIVTGAAQGIGFGIATRLVEAGANVLLSDINGPKAEESARRLTGGAGKASAMQVDVSQDGAGEAVVARCVEQFGSLDVIVNNAGIYPHVPMMATSPELFDRVFHVNVKGLAFCSKAAAAQMIEQGRGGKIINIASIDGIRPSMPELAAYDTSKGAVVQFTRYLALELSSHGINVNAIAPGAIVVERTFAPRGDSGRTEEETRDMMIRFASRVPLGRLGAPEDIGNVAVFLASSASNYMTGDILVVDGGVLLT